MPRIKRLQSETGIYHIVMKGINSQDIFFDDMDYSKFLKCLKTSCVEYEASIIAYCIMKNHIHLLLKFNDNEISKLFQSLCASFVYYYNKKYNRTGGLFNGRYYSSAINDDEYFMSVLKYIHFNPVNACLCNNPIDYKWSSYGEYVNNSSETIDLLYTFSLISKSDFDMLHTATEEDIYKFFIIENKFNKANDETISKFVLQTKDKCNQNEIIEILKSAKVPLSKIAKALDMDWRKLKNN